MGGGVSWVNSGQSYKESTSVNYDSRVILTIKLLIFTTQLQLWSLYMIGHRSTSDERS